MSFRGIFVFAKLQGVFLLTMALIAGCAKSPQSVQHDFFRAVKQREDESIASALKNGAQVDAVIGEDVSQEIQSEKPGQTALLYSVQTGRTEIVPLLLQNKANVNAFDSTGFTALHYAVERSPAGSSTSLIELLLKSGADVNAHQMTGRRTRPLHIACDTMSLAVIKLLLDKGADVNATTDSKVTPLMMVAAKNPSPIKLSILKLLLSKGANKNAKDDANRTARDHALQNNDAKTAEGLR